MPGRNHINEKIALPSISRPWHRTSQIANRDGVCVTGASSGHAKAARVPWTYEE